MAAESCHSRSLSWLVKSCIPADPDRHISIPIHISAPAPTTNLCPTQPPSDEDPPPIAALPDDLLLECLARVPRPSLPPLPAVYRRFASLLSSQAFLSLRRAHGQLHPSLLAISVSDHAAFAQALLQFHASRPKLEVAALPLPLLRCSSSSVFAHARAVVLGREVFLVGRSATLCVDALTGAACPCVPTLFPRKKFAAAAVGGRIYVTGGSARTGSVGGGRSEVVGGVCVGVGVGSRFNDVHDPNNFGLRIFNE